MDVTELAMMLNTIQLDPVNPQEFQQAGLIAKSMMNQLDQEQQMFLYGLFKQSTVGNVSGEKPDEGNIVEFYKWKAWEQFQGFPREDAAKAYVYIVNQLKDSQGTDGQRADDKSQLGPSMSMFSKTEEDSATWSEPLRLYQAVVDGSLEKVIEYLDQGCDINIVDESGLTPLHYAADRGNLEICEALLSRGANINAVDLENQTPLMLAVVCENEKIVELLVKKGADQSIPNSSGETVRDISDSVPAISQLLV